MLLQLASGAIRRTTGRACIRCSGAVTAAVRRYLVGTGLQLSSVTAATTGTVAADGAPRPWKGSAAAWAPPGSAVEAPAGSCSSVSSSQTRPTPPLTVATATSTSSSSAPQLSAESLAILSRPYLVVDTPEGLTQAVEVLATASSIALDVEAFCTTVDSAATAQSNSKQLGRVSLVQACSDAQPVVYLFDVLTLGVEVFVASIGSVMRDTRIRKLFFDCRRDVEALSCQMGLVPSGVLDLQLFFTGMQWKSKSASRRSGMSYVLKHVAGITRQEGDSAVQLAMTLGNRAVWDVRPLPPHFLEYAAGDTRHIQLLATCLLPKPQISVESVERLTAQYVQHYAIGKPVEIEADAKPAEVNVEWLERFLGPGGVCAFCRSPGHVEAECFKKNSGKVKCTHCGEAGHLVRNCYRKFPQMLKCTTCGQLGHTASSCFRANPCKHCGGAHSSANCHQKPRRCISSGQ